MKTIKTILLGSALVFFASSAITATATEEDANAITTQNETVDQKKDGQGREHKAEKRRRNKNADGKEQKHKRHKKHHKNGGNMDRQNHERHDKHHVSPKSQSADQDMDSSESSN